MTDGRTYNEMVTRTLFVVGVATIVLGIAFDQPLVVVLGIGLVVWGWTNVHDSVVGWIRRMRRKALSRNTRLLLVTALGGVLLWLGVWVTQYMALTLLGAVIWVVGISRLGLRARLWAAQRDDRWSLLGAILLVPAAVLLIRVGVSLGVTLIVLGVLIASLWLVITRGRAPVFVGTMIGFVVWMAFWLFAQPEETMPPDPHEDSEVVLVAMGDSYMSGEGAAAYEAGTNDPSENECRRASSAYAYRVADRRAMSLEFVACSGARTSNILETEQFAGVGRQIDRLRSIAPGLGPGSVVLISIGGNDAGFGEIGRTCLVPGSCAVWGELWLRSIRNRVERDILRVHRQIRSIVPDGVPVFAVTYPVVLKPESCLWSPLSNEEHSFLATQLIVDLNDSVKRAAQAAGVNVIDLEDILEENERRICDKADPQQAAVNIIGLGPVRGSLTTRVNPRTWFHGSLHPNPDGHDVFDDTVHEAIEAKLRAIADGAPANPEPAPELLDRRGAPLPRFGEDDDSFTVLAEPVVASHGEACAGEYEASLTLGVFIETSDADESGIRRVHDVEPNSTACMRDANGTWVEVAATDSGSVEIPWAFPQTSQPVQAFYERADGETVVVEVVFCHITPTRCPASGTEEWVGDQLRLLLFGVGLPVWALALIGVNLMLAGLGTREVEEAERGWRSQVLEGPASKTAEGPIRSLLEGPYSEDESTKS